MGKFSIAECPYCGDKLVEIRQRIKGIGTYFVDLETGETEATELHSGLEYTNIDKYVKCANCEKRLNLTVEEVQKCSLLDD